MKEDKKYELLLAAKMGGYKIDCVKMKECTEAELDVLEREYIHSLVPPLNKNMYGLPQQDVNSLKLFDLLAYVHKYIGEETVPIAERKPLSPINPTALLLEEKLAEMRELI